MFSEACVKNPVHRRVSAQRNTGVHPPPLPPGTTEYGQQACGTHPTGMHSCSIVLGEFPIMKPGEDYSWISCTSFNTPYGNMRGHFTMKNLQTGQFSFTKKA